MMAAVAYADENSNYRDPHAWVAEAKAAIALIAALEEKVARLTKERDEALRVRDLAREASNRDLEAKRQAEAALSLQAEETLSFHRIHGRDSSAI
jgi:hypothetical protein